MEIQLTNLKFKNLKRRKNTEKLVIHHARHSTCTVEDVHKWHLNNGWSGIGYHYFVDKKGKVFQGRPEEMIGAHCRYYNNESIGICVQGNYESEYMPEEQYLGLLSLVRFLYFKYELDYVYNHNDLNGTLCPGRNFPTIRLRNDILTDLNYDTYTVKPGDTLYGIAQAIGMNMDELDRINGLDGRNLKNNQVLKIF